MTNYSEYATDLYMRSVLADELAVVEVDNALTALSSITALFPDKFPPDRTFVRPDHETIHMKATGVRFVVYGDDSVIRQIRIPRGSLASLTDAIDVAGFAVSALIFGEDS